jgi:hypothetical protein
VAGCRTSESRHVDGQVGLIEISALGCQECDRLLGRMLHLHQRRLKSDDACISFRAITYPEAHQPVKVTCADAAAGSDILDRQTAMLSVNLSERCGDYSMNVRVLETTDEKALERVDALGGCVFRRVNRDEFVERRAPAQTDPATHYRMRGNPAQHERNARMKSHADQRRRWIRQRLGVYQPPESFIASDHGAQEDEADNDDSRQVSARP